ncbi:hypothetical protein B0H14DRAFT_3748766 [Mycena olivaceomarginata]|nr:hypothetical protein B0H14DRAFT_3748766 [Mycena olivaceomarginata]
MATRPPSSASSSSSSLNEHRILSARYSCFKYRVWFIWSIWYRYSVIWPLSPPWLAIICGSGGNGDLWLWEEEDEEGIREFAIGNEPLSALEARFSRTTVAASPVAHLPSQARLRFIAWLLVAGPLRKQTVIHVTEISSIAMLIYSWAQVSYPSGSKTMLEVYSPDDLRLLSWDQECNCLHRNSPVLHLLYELVVPSWPLFHWVVYRTGVNTRAEYLTTFMDILRGPNQDFFTWDDNDDHAFLEVLTTDKHQLTLYPQDWIEFMVEIPLKTWLQINNMTRINNRLAWDSTDDDTPFRVAAVLLKFLPTPTTREKILTTLGIKLEDYGIAFDTMARAVDRDHQNWSALANFDLEEFWTSASLQDYLLAYNEAICHGIWHTPMPLLERVQLMIQTNNILPCPEGYLQNYRDDVAYSWPRLLIRLAGRIWGNWQKETVGNVGCPALRRRGTMKRDPDRDWFFSSAIRSHTSKSFCLVGWMRSDYWISYKTYFDLDFFAVVRAVDIPGSDGKVQRVRFGVQQLSNAEPNAFFSTLASGRIFVKIGCNGAVEVEAPDEGPEIGRSSSTSLNH